MKKLLGIVVLGLVWCNVGFAEDLSKIDINKLRKLNSEEIITALSGKKLYGYYQFGEEEPYNFEEIHYSNGKYYQETKEGEAKVIGEWKVTNNTLCYFEEVHDENFVCTVHVYIKDDLVYYFFSTVTQEFFAKSTKSAAITSASTVIRDIEINGMTIGDNLLNHYSKDDPARINKFYDENLMITKVIIQDSNIKIYDRIQVTYILTDNIQTILAIEGLKDFHNDFKKCVTKMDNISSDIKKIFYESEIIDIIKNRVQKHPIDKTGKSKFKNISFKLDDGGTIGIRCYDWSTELTKSKGWIDGLSISLESQKKDSKNIVKQNIEPLPSISIVDDKPSFSTTERYYALLIGNDNYKYWSKLEASVNDVKTIGMALEYRYGYQTEILTNVTSSIIRKKLIEYSEKLTEKDNLLIYYAGHGDKIEKMNPPKTFWIPVDAGKKIDDKWINTEDITSYVSMIPAKHILLMVDSCYAGTVKRGNNDDIYNQSKEELNEALIKKLLHKRTRMKITSGGNEPVIDKAISGHSLFAYAFLNILKDNEDFLRATDVYSEIERNLAVIKQEPEWSRMFGDLGGNYFFFVNNNLPEFK